MQTEFVSISDALSQHLEQANAEKSANDPAISGFANPQEAPSEENPVEQPIHKGLANIDERFTKLTSASQKLQAERQAFAEERKQFAAQQAEYAKWKQVIESAKEDPVSLAELAGYEAPDRFATALIEKGTLSPERKKLLELEKEVQESRNWRTQLEQKQAQEAENAQKATVATQLREFGTTNVEKFDLVNRMDRFDDVLGVIQQHYNNTMDPETGVGDILPLETAFQAVEDFLDNQLKPILESPKLRSRYGTPAVAPTPQSALTSALAARKTPGTLSNKNMRPQTGQPKQMTESERMEAAGKALLQAMNNRR